MPVPARYVHTNIVARDWRRLVVFYQQVFGCKPLPPERDYRGPWINHVTALEGEVTIRGIHLRLPGYDEQGPTLEIFQYDPLVDRPPLAANHCGYTHIAFHVDDVSQARQAVLDHGGKDLGQLHAMEVPGAGKIELVYMTDPEGNIVELQHWSRTD